MGKYRTNLFLLGITGGVGSGKTTVSKLLEERGIIRINSDDIARLYTNADSPIRNEISEIFGEQSFPPNQDANRALIAEIAFAQIDKKKALQDLIHPLVRKEFLTRLDQIPGEGIVGWEVPLLFETDSFTLCDATLCVYLDPEKAWERVKKRGGMTREDFLRRVGAQMDIEKKKSLSDFVIHNDTTKEDLEKSLDQIIQEIQKRVRE
jgi:dephospho-CoA kinase